MCGRYTFRSTPESIAAEFELAGFPAVPPRYNIAPTQQVLALRLEGSKPAVATLRWGLVPFWADDLKSVPLLINAKAETAATKPAFRAAFQRRRCLVLADGYYEWQKVGKAKQPHYYHLRDGRPFAFAGLRERWDKGEQPLESCTILTTDANELARTVHDRMPVILGRQARNLWLDPGIEDTAALEELLKPYPAQEMETVAVNPVVNNSRHEGADCLERVAPLA